MLVRAVGQGLQGNMQGMQAMGEGMMPLGPLMSVAAVVLEDAEPDDAGRSDARVSRHGSGASMSLDSSILFAWQARANERPRS